VDVTFYVSPCGAAGAAGAFIFAYGIVWVELISVINTTRTKFKTQTPKFRSQKTTFKSPKPEFRALNVMDQYLRKRPGLQAVTLMLNVVHL